MHHFLSYPSVLPYLLFSLSLFRSITNRASFVLPVFNLVLERPIFLGYGMDCASLSLLLSACSTSVVICIVLFPRPFLYVYPLPILCPSVLREHFSPLVKLRCMSSTSHIHPENVSSSLSDAGCCHVSNSQIPQTC